MLYEIYLSRIFCEVTWLFDFDYIDYLEKCVKWCVGKCLEQWDKDNVYDVFPLRWFECACFQAKDWNVDILTQLRHYVLRTDVEHEMIVKKRLFGFIVLLWCCIGCLNVIKLLMSKENELKMLRWVWVTTVDPHGRKFLVVVMPPS